jgi:hypothetical protein
MGRNNPTAAFNASLRDWARLGQLLAMTAAIDKATGKPGASAGFAARLPA